MGKFGITSLRKAEDLLALFRQTTAQVHTLRSSLKDIPPSSALLYNLDEISNLCSIVADTSQAVSALFPSENWKQVAYHVQDGMHELYSSLNHDLSIHKSLTSLKTSESYNLLSPNQQFFTDTMLKDLEKEGITHNTPTSLSILRLQSMFMHNIQLSKYKIEVSLEEMEGVPTDYRPVREGSMYSPMTEIFLTKSQLISSLNYCFVPSLRVKLFDGISNFCSENLEVLEDLLHQRQQFSSEVGFQNYAEYGLKYQSFPTQPDVLVERLKRCHDYVSPKLENEYAILLDIKALEEQVSRYDPVSLLPSDMSFYMQKHLDSQLNIYFPGYTSHHSIKNYFSIHNVLEGIRNLLTVLFRITCEISVCRGEETWSNDIIKVQMTQGGVNIGLLYLDLFSRPGKSSHPAAKFNIICGKNKSIYSTTPQLPVVVLSCNFPKNPDLMTNLYVSLENLKQQGITLAMLTELYHELGHSLHSILSQNDFQAYSGTRVPLDLAEIPSHVFEHFVTDYDFVKTWARHNGTGAELPQEFFSHLHSVSQEFAGFSHHIQLSIAIFDILLHKNGGVNAAIEEFTGKYRCNELGSRWYCSVEHFVEYAGCYYSYILDKALSHVVWDTVFQRRAFNEKAGEVIRNAMLSQGGNANPQEQLDNLLKPFLIKDDLAGDQKVDPFYVMEYWYKNYFSNTQIVPIGNIKAQNKSMIRY